MAIDEIQYPEATNLAHAEKKFYPIRIPVSHWQLRHYISLPEPDLLYYASGHDIYCLNTASKKRKHIATLPFEARCTAAGYGWVCVGGEDDGHFAAVKLDGSGPRTADVDGALPLDSWSRRSTHTRAASVKVERIGEEIVNSISIHRIQDEEAHLDDIVAVLTNNDKTVRVYSLPQNLETTVLDLPFAMNHATVSPDGTTLVAVGDFNQAYFFSRELQETPPQIPKPHNRLTSAAIEWTLTSVVNLHVSGPNTTTGYFTTAWSPSGQLVAVGSECGYVTVFDVELLADPDFEDEEAIVATIPGSRADCSAPYPGAVRTMMFSPEPWDMLIWAEDQGRLCIGDLRTGLRTKQVITLDPKEEGMKRIDVYDLPSDDGSTPEQRTLDHMEADFLRRYRHAPDNATAVNFATEYIEARRRQRQQRQDLASLRSQTNTPGSRPVPDDDPHGLTSHEQQILESLRTTRQREEARSQGSIPRSVNYVTPDSFNSPTNRSTSSTPNTADSTRPLSEILSAVPDSFPELSRTEARPSSSHGPENTFTLPPLHSTQESAWNAAARSNTSLVRLSETGSRLAPRRRASVVLTQGATSTSPAPAPPHALRASPGPQQGFSDASDNPWRTIEDAMSLARGPLFPASSLQPAPQAPSSAELQAELALERARARSLVRQRDRLQSLRAEMERPSDVRGNEVRGGPPTARARPAYEEGYEALLRRAQMRGVSGREIGVRTAGLAMSADGRTVWAACEEGIFEIEVGVKGRLFWPAVEVR